MSVTVDHQSAQRATDRRFRWALAIITGVILFVFASGASSSFADERVKAADDASAPSGIERAEPSDAAVAGSASQPTEPGRSGIRGYPRSGYVWPYASGPFYGKVDRSAGDGDLLVTSVGTFRLDGGTFPFPRELTAQTKLDRQDRQYFIVQLDRDSLTAERLGSFRERIRQDGGNVVQHLPAAAMIVRLTANAEAVVRETSGLLALVPYHPAFKLDPAIGRTPLPDPEKALSTVYALDVQLHAGEHAEQVADEIRRLDGSRLRVWHDRIQVELPAGRLSEMARLESVYQVHEKLPHVPWDQQTTNAVQAGTIRGNPNPFHDAGIRGAGQVLMVLDDGIQLDAGDLSDTSSSAGVPGPGHRKVRYYGTTHAFGGSGDDQGCDATIQGGFTHGHLVSAIALGNAQHPDVTFSAADGTGASWDLTGVAPDAALAAYDAQVTPAVGRCADTLLGALDVGQLYDPSPTGAGSLGDAYEIHGARTFNLSWGSNNNSYTANAADVDEFLNDNTDAMVFIAAGNMGSDLNNDGLPDPASISEPATAKNGLTIGSHGGADDFGDPGSIDERSFFSGVGPAGATGRVAPVLMAPGEDRGSSGASIAFSCRSNDNAGTGPVVCDTVSGKSGTSYATAAASGSALLVRDYFAQGFYPDGSSANEDNAADLVPVVSGALVKAVLVSSAEFLGVDYSGSLYSSQPGNNGFDHVVARSRFNFEQGYGRIQLDNALPLSNWSLTPTGLIVVDGGIPGGVSGLAGSGITGSIDAVGGETQAATFQLCDDSQELRVALAWVDDPGDALVNDLDLEVFAPDGTRYHGNFFTDDDNGDGIVNPLTENCPTKFDDSTPKDSGVDRSEWSLVACDRPGDGVDPGGPPAHDARNPTEAIFLSPNPQGDADKAGLPILRGGTCDDAAAGACGYDGHCDGVTCIGGTSQVQAGEYSIHVVSKSGGSNGAQSYALVIAGGVCTDSSATLDRVTYSCDDRVTLAVNETGAGLDASIVAARTNVEVLDASGQVVDAEAGTDLGFAVRDPGSLRFVASDVRTTDGTSYDPGNGVLDVRHGDTLRLTYSDEPGAGVGGQPATPRVATAAIDCRLQILGSPVRVAQFGTDTSFFITGGCERNARGLFEFGFPDRYMDAGESLAYRVAWATAETEPLENATVELSCVFADADSPTGCRPGSRDCADPDRRNNPSCTDLTILDPLQVVGRVDAKSAISSNFQIQMDAVISGSPEVEMLLSVTGARSGKTAGALIVNHHRLNVDEASVNYSTDFPHGGTLLRDRNNDGLIENPVTTGLSGFPTSNNTDYVFETAVYSDLTAGTDADGNPVVVNDGINAPWNFDTNDGGFTSGLAAGTDDSLIAETIAQWGEDKNFNNKLDGRCTIKPSQVCDRFPVDPLHCIFCVGGSNDGVPCNTDAQCPDGGTCATTTEATCVNLEDRDPENLPVALLDKNWSTQGGCGWQTKAPGTCTLATTTGCYNDSDCGDSGGTCNTSAPQATGGIWHTGRIGPTTDPECSGELTQCRLYEAIGGLTGQLTWFELLVTPELTKVNQAADETGRPLATAEITQWAWNQAVDLPDNNVSYTLEFDTDLDSLEPVDLKSDFAVLTTRTGDFGAINGGGNPFLTRGWGMFAPLDPVTGLNANGTEGNDRVGQNACYFTGGSVPVANLQFAGVAGPLDDDLNEGYCPSGQGLGGTDPHLNFCTTVCSDRTSISCGSEAACAGTCIGGTSGFCSNDPTTGCQTTCVDGPAEGRNCTVDDHCRACDGGAADGDACGSDVHCRVCVGGSREGLTCQQDSQCPGGGTCPQGTPCAPAGVCPPDASDQCEFGSCIDVACNGTCSEGSCTNGKPGTCGSDSDCAEACVFTSAAIDEFVQPNGPVRNHELSDLNGPDMRFDNLADLFGTAGNRFAGAVGFQNREANSQPEAIAGYGLGIDDMIVEWREFTLEEDQSECAARCVGGAADGLACSSDARCGGGICGGGSCATLNLSANNIYEGSTRLGLSVVDRSPADNDCDGDGTTDGTRDCDGNSVPDVVVAIGSSGDTERVILNATPGSGGVFRGSVPISWSFDLPGTLFIAMDGKAAPKILATYTDLDDGTGRPCQNSVDSAGWGLISAQTTAFTDPGRLVIVRHGVTDNGDDDGWADTGETVTLAVEVFNASGQNIQSLGSGPVPGQADDATNVILRLTSNDPAIACITRPTIAFGDLAAGESRFSDESFEFIIDPDVERTDAFEDLAATLTISIEADEFATIMTPQVITLDLDLDATGGGVPTAFFEGFEGGFGSFTTMHLDADLNPPDSDLANRTAGVLNSEDWRCQYSDPAWEGSASFGNSQGEQCFPNANGAPDVFYFGTTADRAFSGTHSLAYNIFLDAARGFTSPSGQLEAIRMIDPVNLNYAKVCSISRAIACAANSDCPTSEVCEAVRPTLSFKHQVSFLDHRSVNSQPGRSPERGVVSGQVADNEGQPMGVWAKLYPFTNIYDTQANSNFFSCSFDPADDGNTEEDFFDPSDPRRSQGPSTTCAPEFSFVHQGDTDAPFDRNDVGDADPGAGLPGAHGIGTWIEPVFDLSRYRGRRLRVRFLETGTKYGGIQNWEQVFSFNPDPTDDGWFIDDVTITDALTDPPATLLPDPKDNAALPTCDARFCGENGGVDTIAALDPLAGTASPGQVVEIDASASTVDVCMSGILQYRFWVEVDGDSAFNPGADLMLRDWTDNPRLLDTPRGTTRYAVSARCATDPDCRSTVVVTATVDCPSSGNLTEVDTTHAFLHRAPKARRVVRLDATRVGGDKEVHIFWTTDVTVDAIRGDLTTLRAEGAFGGNEVCVADNATGTTSLSDATPTPDHGEAVFWLLRSAAACNEPGAGGSYGKVGEAFARTIDACPD